MEHERPLSVTEAMTRARHALETVRVRVVGEVSEFNDKPGYKAAYFTVCDGDSSMPCLMWRDAYAACGVTLRCGMLVELAGQFSAYVPKGRMQFTVRSLSLAGEGRLRLQVAELARRLEGEGLMRPERKRPLPDYPRRIAVVTSPRGKAIHDVIRTLKRRYPIAELLVAGVQVEGDGAAAAIVEGLSAAEQAGPDVILLVRGGGSYEDLMPFNSEDLARAVARCSIPVVTGIGHEPDTSIADMVADLRASTPTGAAEAATPSATQLSQLLERERRAMGESFARTLEVLEHRVGALAARPVLADPHSVLAVAGQRLDLARLRLERSLPERLTSAQARLETTASRLRAAGAVTTASAEAAVTLAAARLEDLSPLAILARGYAAMFGPDGRRVVRSVTQVGSGDSVTVRVSDGEVGCVVTDVRQGDQNG